MWRLRNNELDSFSIATAPDVESAQGRSVCDQATPMRCANFEHPSRNFHIELGVRRHSRHQVTMARLRHKVETNAHMNEVRMDIVCSG